MDSPPSSEIRFADVAGRWLTGPPEWVPALLVLPVPPGRWEETRLWLNGEPLPLSLRHVGGEARVVAEWSRRGTGRHRVTLEVVREPRVEVEVEVVSSKLSAGSLEALFEDLRTLPSSVALALQRGGAFQGLELRPPRESTVSAELDRLERAVEGTAGRPGLASVLEALAPDPHQVLQTVQPWVLTDRARRIEPAGLMAAMRRPSNLDDRLPIRVPDTRVRHTFDVFENRLVELFVETVMRRLRLLTRAGVPWSAQVRASSLMGVLMSARHQATFLDEVTPMKAVPDRVTMVLRHRSPYRAAYGGWIDLHRSVDVVLRDTGLDSPLENLPRLYEIWGSLVVFEELIRAALENGYRVVSERLARREPGGLVVEIAPGGRPLLDLVSPEGVGLQLSAQRVFRRRRYGFRSVSFTQKPDIVVEMRRPGDTPRLLVFDPKYKLDSEVVEGELSGRPKKIDIDKMHAYRDAIRFDDHRVVEYATILYPGPEVRFGGGVEALTARPGESALLRGRLAELFSEWLRDPELEKHL